MQKLILGLLMIGTAAYALPEHDCPLPTEYVMQFLKKSGTLWKGSRDWKNELYAMKNNEKINTVFAATNLREYTGIAARALHFAGLKGTSVTSEFDVVKKEDHFEVRSKIEDHEVRQIKDKKELEQIQEFMDQYPQGKAQTNQDYSTECEFHVQAFLKQADENTYMLHAISTARCKSKIPTSHFKSEIRK